MARRRNRGRSVNGIFLLDKPMGLSSNKALQRVRSIFDANKAGHTGSLDPLATGILPICLGEATKFSQFLLVSDKHYKSTFTLGITTDTGDCDGSEIGRADASAITRADVEAAIDKFRGEIKQIPSMYSALKHQGQPLYKLARQGVVVEREPRAVTVFSYDIIDFRPGVEAQVDIEVHVSKGTYVRSLAEDLGIALGCGGHVSALRRHRAGPFDEGQIMTLNELEKHSGIVGKEDLDELLKPMDIAVGDRMAVELNAVVAGYFMLGQPVMSNKTFRNGQEGDIVRVFRDDGVFLGVGEVNQNGQVAPKRLIVFGK